MSIIAIIIICRYLCYSINDMPDNTIDIRLSSPKRAQWLRDIVMWRNNIEGSDLGPESRVVIHVSPNIKPDSLEPVHLVTLACLIQYVYDKNVKVAISRDGEATQKYIYDSLGFKYYWSKGFNHAEAKENDNIFNLWRIIDSEKDLYARHVESYLKQNFFQGKDLSAISECLIEAFYNVFDHANAKGNAFSLIKYNKDNHLLSVAISDFGRGIANTIRANFTDRIIENDTDALKLALENSITIKSTTHNKGLGLGNIRSSVDKARIFSNSGLYLKLEDEDKFIPQNFSFPGTLIYFEVDLSKLEDEEILETFTW